MHRYVDFYSLIPVSIWGCFIWGWIVWLRSGAKFGNWRRIALFAGLLGASITTAPDVFMTIHAMITGGYPFYHPVELFCIRYGSLTALIGIFCTAIGKGRPRILIAIVSALNLLIWLADAIAQ